MASQEIDASLAEAETLRVLRHEEPSFVFSLGGGRGTSEALGDLINRSGFAADLEAVEARLLARSASRSAEIAAAGQHTITSGGKRLRALLALLAAGLGSYELERVLNAAAAAELIHAASLVHDDLVDGAAQRRGRATVHVRWDNNVALMLGDYFFALAAHEMSLAPDPRVIAIYAQAVQTIVEGELSPVLVAEPFETAFAQYLYKTGSKTAALFEAACRAGMLCGRGNEAMVDLLGHYGYALGMAFQIVDDVLDYTADARTLGKPAGNDLRQGTITLPLIYAVANGASPALLTVLDVQGTDDRLVEALIAEVRRYGGIAEAQALAEQYAQRARMHLERFAPSPARQALAAMSAFVVARAN
jgi:heptaprenyl diphosphate synthase/octaprenyl-diphosphate synthase